MLTELVGDEDVARAMGINASTCGAIVCFAEDEGYALGDFVSVWASCAKDPEGP